jgi:hypothetical protein
VGTFWLVALALVFLDRVPGGAPPAWRTGQPEPWPSQRQVADARRAARTRPEPVEAPEPAMTGGRPHSSSKKRKRKRRT